MLFIKYNTSENEHATNQSWGALCMLTLIFKDYTVLWWVPCRTLTYTDIDNSHSHKLVLSLISLSSDISYFASSDRLGFAHFGELVPLILSIPHGQVLNLSITCTTGWGTSYFIVYLDLFLLNQVLCYFVFKRNTDSVFQYLKWICSFF